MKNKGFTLIELLAVIVILAIIALIATPIILNIIDDTQDQSVKRSIDHYMSAATTAIARANLNNTSGGVIPRECNINLSGNLECVGYEDKDPILVEIDGEKPTGGTITFENGKITGFTGINIDGNTCELNDGEIVCLGSEVTPNPDPNPGEGVEEYIYRTYPNASELNIGDNISEISYETNRPTTPQTAYLMHKVADNVITESYACIAYVENETRKDACVRGGVVDDDIHNQNKAVIESLIPYYETLTLTGDKGYCTALKCVSDALDIVVSKTGKAYGYSNGFFCEVQANGTSNCYEEE